MKVERSVLVPFVLLAAAASDVPVPARAQDDFYAYVNAGWLAATSIPADVPWISPFVVNTLRVQARTRGLIEVAARQHADEGTDAQRLGDLYRSYMAEAAVERAGLGPLAAELARIDAMRTPDDLARAVGRLQRLHASVDPDSRLPDVTPVSVAVWNDEASGRAMLTLAPAGLGLPGRRYYLDPSPAGAALRAAYRSHVAAMLAMSGATAPDAADRVVRFETMLARAELSEEDRHAPHAAAVIVGDLDRLYPGLPWRSFLASAELGGVSRLTVAEPAYLRAVSVAVATLPIETWRSYLRWQIVRRYAPFLSRPYREADFAFYDRRLLGAVAPRTRAELAALLTEGTFPDAVGRLYVRRYLSPMARRDVTRMAQTIRAGFGERIRAADWLEPETKRAALDKLGKLSIMVGYPRRWESYADVAIRPNDLLGNLQRLSERAYRHRLARLGRPIDRQRWQTPAQSTNAYYDRSANALAIPAGYLQPPWYDPRAGAAANYGGIGTVIGHEMGHAFDDQGARYDGDGRSRDWWTPADRLRFDHRIAALVRQYDGYEPLPGMHVSGRLTISEDVGDLTGVTLAYAALTRSAPARGGVALARDRAFFASFCTHWRANYREPLFRRILAGDGHPPQRYRCNGPLSNFAPFYRAYGVKAGDGMFRPAADRVALW